MFFFRLTSFVGRISDGPGNYTEDNQCIWLIDATDMLPQHSSSSNNSNDVNNRRSNISSTKQPIRLLLNHFATECSWDHLYVYDGDSIFAPLLAVYRLVKAYLN